MKTKNRLFFHPDGRLRTTPQIILASLIVLILLMVGQMFTGKFLYTLTEIGILPSAVMKSYFLSGLLPESIINFIAGGLVILLYRALNKKGPGAMGIPSLRKNIKPILLGVGTVAIMLALIAGVLMLLGQIRFTGLQFHPSILQYFLMMASVSFVEETLNRGYIQSLIKGRSSLLFSWLVPSLVFMAFHLQNPSIKPLGLFNIFLVGLCFSIATEKVGNIWFAFGAHMMWNAGSACVFGLMSVSATTGSILNFEYLSSNLFNGFAASPLYGLIGTAMWSLLILLLVVLLYRSMNTQPEKTPSKSLYYR